MLFSQQTPSNLELPNKELQFFADNPFLCFRDLPGYIDINLEYYRATSGIINKKNQNQVVLIFFSEGKIQLSHICESSFDFSYSCKKNNYHENYLIKQQLLKSTKTYNIIPGSTVVIPASISVRLNYLQALDFAVLIFNPLTKEQDKAEFNLKSPRLALQPQFQQFDSLSYTLISSVLLEIDLESQNYNFDYYTKTLLKTLTIHLLQKYSCFLAQPSEIRKLPTKIQKAIAYIQENIDKKLYIEEIAGVVNVSKYYFCKLFRQSMGISPYQYLLQQKIEHSKSLLQSNWQLSLAEISLRCGFASQSHFSKCFRQHTGTTPKAYRGQLRCTVGDRIYDKEARDKL
ncbi:MAG: hypothetical protein Tsb0014_20510 [Pleurocapsa sp.]